jgi:para-nitrobenzyl esterase
MRALLPLTFALSAGCSAGLGLTYTDPPVELGSADARFAADAAYGDDERNAFDLVHFPGTAAPTPLVVYIHGGGFLGGSKDELYDRYPEDLRELVAAGVAVASIEYRLLASDIDTEGVIKCLGDSRRALQYLRRHAASLNIDPDRVAVAGTSAGAGTALWLGTHDDMAEADSSDLVVAQSTRVRAVAVYETQATYDLVRWTTDIFDPFDLDLFQTAESFGLMQQLLNFYGITERDDLFSPAIEAYRADVDMLALLSSDDAPIWVENAVERQTFPLSSGALFHHPFHATAVVDAAGAVGVEAVAYVPELGIAPETDETAAAFLIRHLR